MLGRGTGEVIVCLKNVTREISGVRSKVWLRSPPPPLRAQ